MLKQIEKGTYLVTQILHCAQSSKDDWDIMTERPLAILRLQNPSDSPSVIISMALKALPSLDKSDLSLDVDNRSDQEYLVCQKSTGRPLIELRKEVGHC